MAGGTGTARMICDGVEIIGHRGAAGLAPENTLAGLRTAAAIGVRHVEVDVRLTADGAAILMHDATLERTTDGAGLVADTALAAIKRLDTGGWFAPSFRGERVTDLHAALTAADALGVTVNLEIKAETAGAAAHTGHSVAEHLERLKAPRVRAYISSFWPQALAAARAAAPNVARALLVEAIPADWPDRIQGAGATALHAAAARLAPRRAREVTETGLPLRCYTVNDPSVLRKLKSLTVSAIFTDFPDRFAE